MLNSLSIDALFSSLSLVCATLIIIVHLIHAGIVHRAALLSLSLSLSTNDCVRKKRKKADRKKKNKQIYHKHDSVAEWFSRFLFRFILLPKLAKFEKGESKKIVVQSRSMLIYIKTVISKLK